ncbi:MAG: Protein of unknown function (DUF1553)/Protein of unknown function (DUF1549)/Planctomycete [Verrucomicrobiales bacterium]|nr:Protein of unknown function (DUF1553)/Protein of unknown function (DUF1549)/Planctomycete [Verrucomicrobiales bacterium]
MNSVPSMKPAAQHAGIRAAVLVFVAAAGFSKLGAAETPEPSGQPRHQGPEVSAESPPAPWWSLALLVRPAVPGTGEENPIDAFVREKLAANHLEPSPEADRRTLIRRLSYDLTGLPLTPEEMAAFIEDDDPQAYEKLVDRLLASPRHGEHWARHWLDVASYADTHGNDHDFIRPHAWPWRDWVIRAFNEDKPYARFVQEQVAGDALFPDDPQATVALGFLAAGPWDHTLMVTVREDTVDHRMAQNLDRDAMVTATMGTFQSLTVQCARCHNHKFDPVSQREYYALQAVFAGVDRADRPFDENPSIHVSRRHLLAEQKKLKQPDEAFLTRLESLEITRKVTAWEEAWKQREKAWQPLSAVSVVSTGGATLTRQEDGSWLAGGTRPDRDTYILTARRPAGKLGALRLEAMADDRLPQRGPGRWDNGNFHLSEFRAYAAAPSAGESAKPLPIARATADHNEGPGISAAQAVDGREETQWGVHPRYGEPHQAVFELKEPAEFPEDTLFTIVMDFRSGAPGHGLGRFRISAGSEAATPMPTALDEVLRLPADKRSPAQRRELALTVLREENRRALEALPPPQMVYAVASDFPPDGENFKPAPEPRPIHLLARGELSRPGDLIGPAALGCIPGMPADLGITDAGDESARRAALALWLTDSRNGLTWRSIVNRVWHWHFGRGLCDTPNDFGKMGGTPSNTALLDWLAVWFRDDAKGSLKALHRLIVTSHAWRQSSLAWQGAETDADNRLLWRQNRNRLSAEAVRDTLLMLGRQLDLTVGGPAAVQFNAKGDATFNPGGNPPFVDYEHFNPDASEARRRAVYRFLFRTVPDPLMAALDSPDGGSVAAVRGVSTTAVQAFALMNNPFVIRWSGHIASRVTAATAATPEDQVEAAFKLILLRQPTDAERTAFAGYLQRHGAANACQLLINSNEFLHLD